MIRKENDQKRSSERFSVLSAKFTAILDCETSICDNMIGYVPVKSKLQHPPHGQPPGHLNFWKIFVQIIPSPGRKAVQMPPSLGKLPDYCFGFSVASIASEAVHVNMVY